LRKRKVDLWLIFVSFFNKLQRQSTNTVEFRKYRLLSRPKIRLLDVLPKRTYGASALRLDLKG